MAEYSVERSANKTLTTTTVDTVAFTAPHGSVSVVNRAATNTIWVTAGRAPVNPVVAADNVIPVLAGRSVVLAEGTPAGFQVKVLGSADAYSVYGGPRH